MLRRRIACDIGQVMVAWMNPLSMTHAQAWALRRHSDITHAGYIQRVERLLMSLVDLAPSLPPLIERHDSNAR
jgi:hypothetical protein